MATSSKGANLLTFDEAYEIIKKNDQALFDQVYRTLLTRSDYLTVIPPNESYSILHYLVIHGATDLFNKSIAIPGLRFNILTKTATKPPQDISEIASANRKKSSNHKRLAEIIGQLVNLDRFVEYAKQRNIDDALKMLETDPELVNEKPPYRKFYLIHHLAYDKNREGFDRIRQACKVVPMDLTLLTAGNQTASEVALEERHKDFADYLESLSPQMREIRLGHERIAQNRQQVQKQHSEQLEKDILQNGGGNLLPAFTCPITKEIFHDPVILSDGITYERQAIEKWLTDGKTRSPVTNISLENKTLLSNLTVKQALEELAGNQKK